jgi:hypothetical protein
MLLSWFFLVGLLKGVIVHAPTSHLPELNEKVKLAFRELPDSMVTRAVYDMKKMSRKLLKTGEENLGKLIRL